MREREEEEDEMVTKIQCHLKEDKGGELIG